jgi:hypothetical protein
VDLSTRKKGGTMKHFCARLLAASAALTLASALGGGASIAAAGSYSGPWYASNGAPGPSPFVYAYPPEFAPAWAFGGTGGVGGTGAGGQGGQASGGSADGGAVGESSAGSTNTGTFTGTSGFANGGIAGSSGPGGNNDRGGNGGVGGPGGTGGPGGNGYASNPR